MLVNVSLSLLTSPCNCLLQKLCFANDEPIEFFVVFMMLNIACLLYSTLYSFRNLRALPVLAQ